MRATIELDKAQILTREIAEIRQRGGQVRRAHPKPSRQRRRIFVDRDRRDPASLAGAAVGGVIRSTGLEHGNATIYSAALHRAAKDQMMAAPAMIRAAAVGLIGP